MRDHILNLLKFLFAILLVPVTVILTGSFIQSLDGLSPGGERFFLMGVFLCTALHIFVCEPQGIYQFGQRLTGSIFGFYPPLAAIASRVLPIYTIFSFTIFYLLNLFHKKNEYENYFMFLAGFTLVWHLISTARQLREEDQGTIKPNYFLFIQSIYIFIIFLTVTIFLAVVPKFSFSSFFNSATQSGKNFYATVFHQLFVP